MAWGMNAKKLDRNVKEIGRYEGVRVTKGGKGVKVKDIPMNVARGGTLI